MEKNDPTKCISCFSHDITQINYQEGTIFLCGSCQLQWGITLNDIKSEEADFDISNNYYMSMASLGELEKYRPFSDFFKILSNENHRQMLDIFDVGCGNGAFIQLCLKKSHNAQGVELNKQHQLSLPAELVEKVEFMNVNDLDFGGKLYDVITFWDCFEHIPNAFEVLDKLRNHLKSDGLIYLRVNNNKDIYNYLARWLLKINPKWGKLLLKACFSFPGHVYNFNTQSINNLCQIHGWKIKYSDIGETPASRLTRNLLLRGIIRIAYIVNKAIGGGKIGNYYICPIRD